MLHQRKKSGKRRVVVYHQSCAGLHEQQQTHKVHEAFHHPPKPCACAGQRKRREEQVGFQIIHPCLSIGAQAGLPAVIGGKNGDLLPQLLHRSNQVAHFEGTGVDGAAGEQIFNFARFITSQIVNHPTVPSIFAAISAVFVRNSLP